MGRPDRACLFTSARWVAIYLFFCPHGRVRTRGGRLRRPAEDALRGLIERQAGDSRDATQKSGWGWCYEGKW
jgi:hypothetical protein